MKTLVTIKKLEDINKINSDAYLVGLKDLCVHIPAFSMEEIIFLSKKVKLFVAVNKNIHEEELEFLKDSLIKLDTLSLEGIVFYDYAVLEYKEELSLQSNLVWHSEHMTTNYNTINLLKKKGISYAFLSNEITYDEMLEIKQNSKVNLIYPLFGHMSMFTSKRHLISNYLETFSLSSSSDNYYMEKEGNSYPLEENKFGTNVYTNYIVNGLKEAFLLQNKNSYIYLNSFNIHNDVFVKVLEIFKSTNKDNYLEKDVEINNLLEGKTSKGFLYRNTVYKVKQ